jgi:hypothetical protein
MGNRCEQGLGLPQKVSHTFGINRHSKQMSLGQIAARQANRA